MTKLRQSIGNSSFRSMRLSFVNSPDMLALALQAMHDNGFHPEFSPQIGQQLAGLNHSAPAPSGKARDLRNLLWSSIDNDESRDLDQIEYAERRGDSIAIWIGVADVDAYVPVRSPIDVHAASESTTVYTRVKNFSMIPEQLSTGLTSLLVDQDRQCLVVEMEIGSDGTVSSGDVYWALVRNRAQLAYSRIGPWLEGHGPGPENPELQAQLRLQDEAAQCMRASRYRHGALNVDTIETQAIFAGSSVVGVEEVQKNRASQLIEDFMIAANATVAKLLSEKGVPSIRRVVKTPKRWPRIVELAARYGETLPQEPDSGALNAFLLRQRQRDPIHSADLSLSVIKLMGPGEYVVQGPGDEPDGHFSLAVHDYTHSTAPNRRFTDLVTQRLLKAMQGISPVPYTRDELEAIATHCTEREDAARKVERLMGKRLAALALQHRTGQVFDAVVTGVKSNGTYVRALHPPVDGRLMQGEQGVDVGDKLRVRLLHADPVRGFIDFGRVG